MAPAAAEPALRAAHTCPLLQNQRHRRCRPQRPPLAPALQPLQLPRCCPAATAADWLAQLGAQPPPAAADARLAPPLPPPLRGQGCAAAIAAPPGPTSSASRRRRRSSSSPPRRTRWWWSRQRWQPAAAAAGMQKRAETQHELPSWHATELLQRPTPPFPSPPTTPHLDCCWLLRGCVERPVIAAALRHLGASGVSSSSRSSHLPEAVSPSRLVGGCGASNLLQALAADGTHEKPGAPGSTAQNSRTSTACSVSSAATGGRPAARQKRPRPLAPSGGRQSPKLQPPLESRDPGCHCKPVGEATAAVAVALPLPRAARLAVGLAQVTAEAVHLPPVAAPAVALAPLRRRVAPPATRCFRQAQKAGMLQLLLLHRGLQASRAAQKCCRDRWQLVVGPPLQLLLRRRRRQHRL